MYNYIIDPKTNKNISIHTTSGKQLLLMYMTNVKHIGGKKKRKKKKKDSKGRSNPLSGLDPISQLYELYDNIEITFNNGGQIIKILEQLSAINKSLYCDLIKKITKFMCTLKSDSKLCEMTTSYYNTKC